MTPEATCGHRFPVAAGTVRFPNVHFSPFNGVDTELRISFRRAAG
jgi:hypothetical protein